MASGITSIWGRPYPLSTDAPAVHTDIQALANSLETVPTYPTTATTSRTGVSGESVAVSPSQTLTLPAAPVKGDRIQIIALGTVTGATPVTVAGGGKVINGVGLSAVSSFIFGAPNSNATVQYDGTAWRVIDGMQDTGWLSFASLGTGFSLGGGNPAARLVGDKVFLRGYLFYSGAGGSSLPMATLPLSAMVPAVGDLIAGGTSVAFFTGATTLTTQSTSSSATYPLHCSYPIT